VVSVCVTVRSPSCLSFRRSTAAAAAGGIYRPISAVRAERSNEWTASILQGIFTRKIVTALRDPTETPKASWGWGMGKAIPQPNSESGERHKLPQRGSGLSGNDFGDF